MWQWCSQGIFSRQRHGLRQNCRSRGSESWERDEIEAEADTGCWKCKTWKWRTKKTMCLEIQDWKMTDTLLAISEQTCGVWKMQDWKMTDTLLAISEQTCGVWKMQDWKMTDIIFSKLRTKLQGPKNDGPLFASHTTTKKDAYLRYDTIRYDIFTCAQKLSKRPAYSLAHDTETKS